MKKLRNITLLMLLGTGAAFAQITVQGDKKTNTDFSKYKTFGWVSADQPSTQVIEYTYTEFVEPNESGRTASTNQNYDKKMKNDKAMKGDKMKGDKMKGDKNIKHHKDKSAKGYSNGDVVAYSYSFILPAADSTINNSAIHSINEELEGRGYRKDQMSPDLLVAYKIFDRSTQIKGYNAPPTKVNGGDNEVRQPQDTVTYALKPGTVLISLLDAKTSTVVWEGYASGVAQKDDVINDKLRVKEAINLIFKKYEFRGDKNSIN